MREIIFDLPIAAPVPAVFQAISTPAGLDQWWTARSAGIARAGAEYELWFGPEFDWRATVTRCEVDRAFELRLTRAMPDWVDTTVGFTLDAGAHGTELHFVHRGWPEKGPHYRTSAYCWAMYLRILKRFLEHGEIVPYADRLAV